MMPAMGSPARDVGLGTTYERAAFYELLRDWTCGHGVRSATEGPVDGVAGMPGLHLLPLAHEGCEVTVQHAEEQALARVRRIYARCGLSEQLTLERRSWPQRSRRFDLVVSFNALPLVDDWRAYLAALAAGTRRWLLVVLTNPWSYGARLAATRRWLARAERGLFDHEATRSARLRKALAGVGHVVEQRALDCPWWPDLFVPAGQTLAEGLRDWLPGAGAGARGTGRARRAATLVHDEETFPCDLAHGWPPALAHALGRHPCFERAPLPLRWIFAHHQAYWVEVDRTATARRRCAPTGAGGGTAEPLHGERYLEDNRSYTRWKVERVLRQPLRGQRVLDVGCAAGLLTASAVQAALLLGLDRDPAVLQHARAHGYEVLRVDLDTPDRLPLPDAGFDVVLALDVLEHLAAPLRLLRELRRVLRPGGLLILAVPNGLNVLNRALVLLGRPEDITDRHHWLGIPFSDHLQRVAFAPLVALLRREGFAVRSVEHFVPHTVRHARLRWLQPAVELCRGLDLAQHWPGLFSFAFLLVCARTDGLPENGECASR